MERVLGLFNRKQASDSHQYGFSSRQDKASSLDFTHFYLLENFDVNFYCSLINSASFYDHFIGKWRLLS